MSCMKLRTFNENAKVLAAIKPPTTCPMRRCPIDCNKNERSSLYHPDYRTVNQYSCTQACHYIPTEKALKEIKFDRSNVPLYNQPKRSGNGLKIIMLDRTDPRCYPHRDINQLHRNLRGASCGMSSCQQVYVCADCGCGYRKKAEGNSCCGSNQEVKSCQQQQSQTMSPIYFHVGESEEAASGCEDNDCSNLKNTSDDCDNLNNSFDNTCNDGNHFPDCQCGLCKKRRDKCSECPQDNLKSKKDDCWVPCQNPECQRCQPKPPPGAPNTCSKGIGSQSCVTQPNQITKLPDPKNPGRSTEVPVHHVFNVTNDARRNQVHCVIDVGGGQSQTSSGCSQFTGKKKCDCAYCQKLRCDKQSLHGAHCPCNLCSRLRCDSRKKPGYYSSLRSKTTKCCPTTQPKTCAVSSVPVCYPIMNPCSSPCKSAPACTPRKCSSENAFGYSCQSNCLCHVMIPNDWEPQQCQDQRQSQCCGNQVKLPRCNTNPCNDRSNSQVSRICRQTAPCLVRSIKQLNGNCGSRKTRCAGSYSNCG